MTTTQSTSTSTTTLDGSYCPVPYQPPVGTCPTDYSVNMPSFISNSSLTSFGYPIFERVVCDSSTLVLTCSTDYVLHIYAGYYGIQSLTTYTECLASSDGSEIPAAAYSPASFTQISASCEGKSSCKLVANAQALYSPLVAQYYNKQLFVQYQCIQTMDYNTTISKCAQNTSTPLICPSITTPSTIKSATWCDDAYGDGFYMTITCSTGLIRIQCAYYGLHPAITGCSTMMTTNRPVCYAASSYTTVSSTCTGKKTCTLSKVNLNSQ